MVAETSILFIGLMEVPNCFSVTKQADLRYVLCVAFVLTTIQQPVMVVNVRDFFIAETCFYVSKTAVLSIVTLRWYFHTTAVSDFDYPVLIGGNPN